MSLLLFENTTNSRYELCFLLELKIANSSAHGLGRKTHRLKAMSGAFLCSKNLGEKES
jgi:hypothetical protein